MHQMVKLFHGIMETDLSSGKVRVVKTYYKNDRYCRIFQSYIKLNGAKKHKTKHVCKVDNMWKF